MRINLTKETELEVAVTPHLSDYFQSYSFQVPIHNRVLDLAALDHDGRLIAVEFKLRNWKRALAQVLTHKNSFDYLYVCVPQGTFVSKLKSEAEGHGIGVMVFDATDESLRVELKAERVPVNWKPNQEYVRDYIMQGNSS